MIIKKETTNSSFFGLPDTCIIQYPFEISACGKDYFATAQNICIHILFLTLRLTSESRTKRPEIIQLHRHVIEQIPFNTLIKSSITILITLFDTPIQRLAGLF